MDEAVRTYYEILQAGAAAFDADRLRAILAPDLAFEGPLAGRRIGAEPFIRGVTGFIGTARRLEMLQHVHAGELSSALYDAELPGGTVRFAEFFRTGQGRIQTLQLLYDPSAYVARGGR